MDEILQLNGFKNIVESIEQELINIKNFVSNKELPCHKRT